MPGRRKRTIDELAKNLPVEEIVIDLPESMLTCDKCGGTFKPIGKKLVRRELIIIPQSEKILEYYSCTYEVYTLSCKSCRSWWSVRAGRRMDRPDILF